MKAHLLKAGIAATGKAVKDQITIRCPVPSHRDSEPSCKVNVKDGRWRCFGCRKDGDLARLIAYKRGKSYNEVARELGVPEEDRPAPINPSVLERFHQALLTNKDRLDFLRAKRGIEYETVRAFQLGWSPDEDRFIIPVYDQWGDCINLRKYKPDAGGKDKMIGLTGRNEARLYPEKVMEAATPETPIIICEGEMDCLCALERGFQAVTGTGGASTWRTDWSHRFEGLDVWVAYDVDKPGRDNGRKVADQLLGKARTVKVLDLPIAEGGDAKDITDYFTRLGYGSQDLINLATATVEWGARKEYTPDKDETVYPTSLSNASKAQYHGKTVSMSVVVSAMFSAPYLFPAKGVVDCPGNLKICRDCKAKPSELAEPYHFEITAAHPDILSLVNVPAARAAVALRHCLGIPRSCKVHKIHVEESGNVEECELIPQLSVAEDEERHVSRRAFCVGHGLSTNVSYQVKGTTLPLPTNQMVVHLLSEAKPSADNLDLFDAEKDTAGLQVFQPREWTDASLALKLGSIYQDFACNVTGIFEREGLHLAVDLSFHGPIRIPWEGKREKGWCEVLVMGDSGQGKSETAEHLRDHYRLGEMVDCKRATVAGLLGGMKQDSSGPWWITWGVIPLNDRGHVTLEEAKGLSQETLASLTTMRSRGIAEITGIRRERTRARTRLLWITNPRSDRQLNTYTYGVEAIKEFAGNLEDIRRFEFAYLVASGDVSTDILNRSKRTRPNIEHVYTSHLSRKLLLWGWSRKPEDIHVENEAEDSVLSWSKKLSAKYSEAIPLVEAADHRKKLLRLAASLAARTFSCGTSPGQLIIRACHVEYIAWFMDHHYSSNVMGYERFSRHRKAEQELAGEDEIVTLFGTFKHPLDLIRGLLSKPIITQRDVRDFAESTDPEADAFIGLLTRKQAISRHTRGYFKKPAFIRLLNRLETEPPSSRAGTQATLQEEPEF